ncbi:MAG: MarR family transcriptional regulator [Bacteroidales bacterium]|nr:MarR family transcriptional regulator [Bacteroidales bacterium]
MVIAPQQLDDEVSFKLYTLNRLIQQTYQAFLLPLNLTYPQYLVMKVLMEKDNVPVHVISSRLMLESNTVTPLLQRMEKQGLLTRALKCEDQRQRIISLTCQGKDMRHDIEQVSVLVASSLAEMEMDCTLANGLGGLLSEFIKRIQ